MSAELDRCFSPLVHSFPSRIPNVLLSLSILYFSDFESRIILKLFSCAKGATVLENQKIYSNLFWYLTLSQAKQEWNRTMNILSKCKGLSESSILTPNTQQFQGWHQEFSDGG